MTAEEVLIAFREDRPVTLGKRSYRMQNISTDMFACGKTAHTLNLRALGGDVEMTITTTSLGSLGFEPYQPKVN